MRSTRRQPYTARGIARVPCVKCGAPSAHQWRICATDAWTAVCEPCDLQINSKIARWAFGADAEPIIARYRSASP